MGGLLGNGDRGSCVDVYAALDSALPQRVADLLSMGCLVSLGTTRDRGALSVTITLDGDWDREYFRSAAEATDWLEHAIKVLRARGLGEPAQDPTTTQKRPRARSRLA
jgi:hypothetical protein